MSMFDNRKAWIYSAVGHVLILAVSLLAFVVKPHATTPPDSVNVDIISSDDLAHITKGLETGDNKIKTQRAEKIAEPQKIDDAVGKIDKKQVVTATAPAPVPEKPKPVEKKPEPPKPVVEKKDEPKKAEKKPDAEDRSDRRSPEEGRRQEAGAEAGGESRAAAEARAEALNINSIRPRSRRT